MKINGCIIGPKANLRGANLSGASLSGANLSEADLSGANLSGASLSGANLSEADLSGANLSEADLSWAYLSEANLSEANLSGANLSWAYLSEANLSEADLSGADLSEANLSEADLSGAKNIPHLPETIIVPEGALIVYKKVSNGIVKLQIPSNAKRSNGTTRKCRAECALVLEKPPGRSFSIHDPEFEYKMGEIVRCHHWEPNRWAECTGGIHFFLTREEAENY